MVSGKNLGLTPNHSAIRGRWG